MYVSFFSPHLDKRHGNAWRAVAAGLIVPWMRGMECLDCSRTGFQLAGTKTCRLGKIGLL